MNWLKEAQKVFKLANMATRMARESRKLVEENTALLERAENALGLAEATIDTLRAENERLTLENHNLRGHLRPLACHEMTLHTIMRVVLEGQALCGGTKGNPDHVSPGLLRLVGYR